MERTNNKIMKKYLFFTLLLLYCYNTSLAQNKRKRSRGEGQYPFLKELCCEFVNDQSLPQSQREDYRHLATQLAQQLLEKEVAFKESSMDSIPRAFVDKIYNSLVAVLLTPQDSFMQEIFHLHIRPSYKNDSIITDIHPIWLRSGMRLDYSIAYKV